MTQTERIKLLAQAIGADIALLKTTIGDKADLSTTDKTNLVAAINELAIKINAVETLQQSASEIDDSEPKANRVYSSNKVQSLIDDIYASVYSSTKVQSLIDEIHTILGTLTASGYADVGYGLKTLKDKVDVLEQKTVDLTALIKDTEETETSSVWSSTKTNAVITAAVYSAKSELTDKIIADVAKVKSDILGAGVPETLDTLAEIADKLNGDAALVANMSVAINNRVRFDEEQVLSSEQKTIACTNIGIGEPNTDFVAIYNTAKA